MGLFFLRTAGQHVTLLDSAPIRIGRRCISTLPPSSLGNARKTWASDTPRMLPSFMNVVRKSKP